MKTRTVMVGLLCVVVLSSFQAIAQTTRYVDNLGSCAALVPCHATLMDAVNGAAPSDVIEVFPGVYHERVVFGGGKDGIVLRAHFGALTPVIAGGITLRASGVQVRGFQIEGAVGADGLLGAGAVIDGNLIRASPDGISFHPCASATIANNRFLGGGIALDVWSDHCVVEGNLVDGGSIKIGDPDLGSTWNTVRGNLVRGGDIVSYAASPLNANTVELNRVEGGSIRLSAVRNANGNVIRGNDVRGGGISLGLASFGAVLGSDNLVDANFVSRAGDGIALQATGGHALIRDNTSVENSGCDLKDSALAGNPQNTWSNNRFRTKCGAATE